MLERIAASLSSLAPAEQRVGELVLADPRQFSELPVAVLAERAQVSKPTVVRFCRSMGYDGLADFKLKLVGSVSEGVPFIHRSVDSDDKTSDIVVKVIDNAVAAFLKYRNDASASNFEKAINALVQTQATGRRIEFFGVGNSGFVAQDGQHKFFRLGLNTISYHDSHVQLISAVMLKAGDCLIAISNSGRSRDMIEAVEEAKKNGATTILITASGTPLSKIADIHLAADHPEGYEIYSPMVSRLLHLLIIDILATGVALKLGGDSVQPMLKQIKNKLKTLRYV